MWRREEENIAYAILEPVLILFDDIFQLYVRITLNAVDTRLKAVKIVG